ncbi:conserved Plasmodium protein, unknown function [Plasmodium vinckei lentum]|uniref:RRM domain-containing protein n=1 Tax=Plasmodium vinckei lentum TaxID=138297 RepID=A0A6V7SWT8_PLAVN|nr:conserved Plasmodium protein, unknown function [Plasmodium vinckei lentum]
MDYSELDEDEDLYEGLEGNNLEITEKTVEEKKKEPEITTPKLKEQSFEKSRKSLYKKLSGAKDIYTKKDPYLFFGAPQTNEEEEELEEHEGKFLLLVNLLYFINDMVIRKHCENIGKVKRVVILEDEHYCKSLGICLIEFYYLDNSQNYVAYIKEKLKADVKTVDAHLEEQIKNDEIYNYGGYLNSSIIELIKRNNSEYINTNENIHDVLNKSMSLNRHPLFTWFNTSLKDVLNSYVKSELKKKKKYGNDFLEKKYDANSDSDDEISTHILEYASKKNKMALPK